MIVSNSGSSGRSRIFATSSSSATPSSTSSEDALGAPQTPAQRGLQILLRVVGVLSFLYVLVDLLVPLGRTSGLTGSSSLQLKPVVAPAVALPCIPSGTPTTTTPSPAGTPPATPTASATVSPPVTPSISLTPAATRPAASPAKRLTLDDYDRALYEADTYADLSTRDLPEEGLAPMTKEAQAFIFRHQYRPASQCQTANYMRSVVYDSGFGSQMHVYGWHLGHAISQGRIWYQKGGSNPYAPPQACGDDSSWRCYFLPETNCTEFVRTESDPMSPDPGQDMRKNFVPDQLSQMVRSKFPTMTEAMVKYWWRAQSIAFIMRLNGRTAAALKELRTAASMTMAPANHPALAPYAGRNGVLFPLPRGTVSIHVRHGDKHKEMQLVPWSAYFDGAVHLHHTLPLSVPKIMFVSTEDPEVITAARDNDKGWAAIYSDIPRINGNGWDHLNQRPGETTKLHLLQLLMALEADAWVGTRGSNWNRMIDELRCVWVPKCQRPYLEVGADRSWRDGPNAGDEPSYDWR